MIRDFMSNSSENTIHISILISSKGILLRVKVRVMVTCKSVRICNVNVVRILFLY